MNDIMQVFKLYQGVPTATRHRHYRRNRGHYKHHNHNIVHKKRAAMLCLYTGIMTVRITAKMRHHELVHRGSAHHSVEHDIMLVKFGTITPVPSYIYIHIYIYIYIYMYIYLYSGHTAVEFGNR